MEEAGLSTSVNNKASENDDNNSSSFSVSSALSKITSDYNDIGLYRSAIGLPNDGITLDSSVCPYDEENCLYQMPIIGYEVLEERNRFTIFKIQIIHHPTGDKWFVFRRYSDFLRVNNKLLNEFPGLRFSLPSKKWFGDNFDPLFLEDRIIGLQTFINNIIAIPKVRNSKTVRNLFCLDNPPKSVDCLEESREICHNFEETITLLEKRLKDKDLQINYLKSKVAHLISCQERLVKALRHENANCSELLQIDSSGSEYS